MFRTTREFIRQRQPHSHAVVCQCAVKPYHRYLAGDIVEVVGQEVKSDPSYRAVAGWRIHPRDMEGTRLEPWWWVAKPDPERGWSWWDVQPVDHPVEYVMDQDLCMARILELDQRLAVRPCDLRYDQGLWSLDTHTGLKPISELTTREILSEPRPSRFDLAVVITEPSIVWASVAR